MGGSDVDLSIGYDWGGEFDAVAWRVSGIRSTVVQLCGQGVGIVGAERCRSRGSDGWVLVLDRISVVDDPQDSVRSAVGGNQSYRAIAAHMQRRRTQKTQGQGS